MKPSQPPPVGSRSAYTTGPNVRRRRCLKLAAGGLAAASLGFVQRWANAAAAVAPDTAEPAEPPEPVNQPGPYQMLEMEWIDTSRRRAVPVRLYLPAQRADAIPNANPGGVPLVVFSHGIGGSRRGYSWLGRHIAGQGLACLHLQHVGSDSALWFGNIMGLLGRLRDAAQATEAIDRVLDLSFALDTLLASDLASRIDTRHIIAAGHSYGANTALLACGARVPKDGRQIDLQDRRFSAAIVISAPPFYGQSDFRDILSPVVVPSLHITATEDVIRIPGYYSGLEDRLAVFEATGSTRKWLAVFEGGSHSMFTDRSGSGGVMLNGRVKEASKTLTTAFLRAVLQRDERLLARWPQQHGEILSRFMGPAST